MLERRTLLSGVVTGIVPANGAMLSASPALATVDFSVPFDVATIQADDLRIDEAASTGFTVIDEDTVSFHLPTLADGGVGRWLSLRGMFRATST